MTNSRLSEFKSFSGHLSLDDQTLALNFRAAIDGAGQVEFEFDSIPLTNETKFICLGWNRERSEVTQFGLKGIADDGTRFETNHLHFNSLGESSDASGSRMKPVGRCSKGVFHYKLTENVERPALRIRLKGFENFDSLHAECRLGHVAMSGQHSFEDPNTVTGSIAVQPDTLPADVSTWRVQAEKLLEHIRRVMSFAASALLQAPITEFFYAADLEVTVWSQTRQASSSFRVVHFLSQETIFDAAVKSFFDPPIEVKNMFFAIEWFAMDASYNEVRLVNAMTALETLIDSNLNETEEFIQAKGEFEKTRRILRNDIRRCLTKWSPRATDETLVELNEKLIDLNRRSLLRKLEILTLRWGVPLDGITKESLEAAKRARDRVVHRGQYYDDSKENDADLWTHVTVVREVVVRFLLTAIGYKGQYISYVGGYHDAVFPPSKQA